MPDYSDDQLKDLLAHIAETVRPDATELPDGSVIDIEAPDLANAFRKCGIPAQSSYRPLFAEAAPGVSPMKMVEITPHMLTVGGLLFNPWTTHFTNWDSVMAHPSYQSVQDDHRAKGLICEWGDVSLSPSPPKRLARCVEDMLVEIITHWQAQTQRDAIAQEVPVDQPKAVPAKRM